jgi:hypothetical protein
MGASHSKKEEFKTHQKSITSCPGCGIRNDFGQPSEISCKWHTREKEEAIFRKLSAANVQFVTLKNPKSEEERNQICELVTFLEMLVTPQPVLEPIAVEYADKIKEFFETAELCKKRKEEGERILFHSSRSGCEPCEKAKQMLSSFKNKHFSVNDSISRLFSLHRPAFPPRTHFENVENLTLEISDKTSAEIKRRLVEHFEIVNMKVSKGPSVHNFEYMKQTSPFEFDLKPRFPNLKILTIMDHSYDESHKVENYDLLPHFAFPSSLRVLRVNKNVLDARVYQPFMSRIGGITDLLIDFMPDDMLLSAVQEPPLLLDRKLKHTILPVEHMDASLLPNLTRFRCTNATPFDVYRYDPTFISLSELMSRFKLPETLESFEVPVTSGLNPFVVYDPQSRNYNYPPDLKHTFTQLATHLRCVYPPNIRCVDVSTPFNIATKEVKAGSRSAVAGDSDEFFNMWEQHETILDIVSAFEVCYFEDVILHIFRNAFNQDKLVPLFKDAEVERTVKNLTRNLHLLLSGSQFVLPPSFAENVIKKVHDRYAIVIEKSTTKLGMSSAVMAGLSKRRMAVLSSRASEQKLHKAVDETFLNKLKRTVLKELMDIKPKFGLHAHRVPSNLEDRSAFAFSCKTPVCELAISAGLLSGVPLEALPKYECVKDDKYDSYDDGDEDLVVSKGCGKEWNASETCPGYRICGCYPGFTQFGKKRLNPQIAFDLTTIPRLPFAVSGMTLDSYRMFSSCALPKMDPRGPEGHVSPKSPSPKPESKGGGKNTRRSNRYYKLNRTKRVNRWKRK